MVFFSSIQIDESNEQESEGKRLLHYEKRTKREFFFFEKRTKRVSETKRENLMKKRESISDSLNLFIYIQELGITAHLCYHFS